MLRAEDLRLAKSDPGLPGLRHLLDDEAVQGLLQRQCDLQSVTSRYIRYKPGVNALVAFDMESNGRTIPVYLKTYAREALSKLRASTRRPPRAGSLGDGYGHAEEVPCSWWVFPNDARIGPLQALGDDEATRALLARHLSRPADSVARASVEAISYRPERRFVGRVLNDEGNAQAVLKLYTREGWRTAAPSAKYYHSGDRVDMAGLIASSRAGLLGFSWLPGRNLEQVLREAPMDVSPLAETGAAIAELHRQKPRGLLVRTPGQRIAGIEETARGIGLLAPELASTAGEIATRLIEALSGAPQAFVPIHGDLYTKQVIVSPAGRIGLIDMDEARRGSPAEDMGNLLAHLEKDHSEGTCSPDDVTRWKHSLLSGYAEAAGLHLSSRIRLYAAISLFHLVQSPFRCRARGWTQGMAALLTRTGELLQSYSDCSQTATFRFTGKAQCHATATVPATPSPPHDEAMPYLPQALDPRVMESLLLRNQPCLSESRDRLRLQRATLTRLKKGRRCVVEYTLTLDGRDVSILGKIKAKNLQRTGYRIQDALWLNGFGPEADDGLCVPQPIGMVPEFNMTLQRKITPSTPLEFVLEDERGRSDMERVAAALYKMHTIVVEPAQHRLCLLHHEVARLHRRLEESAASRTHLAPRLIRLREAVDQDAAGAGGDAVTPCFIHRDAYHDQFVVQGDRLFVLDFDLGSYGDPAIDVGNFLAHITERSLREYGDPETLADREAALLESYLSAAGTDLLSAIMRYRRLTLARLVWISIVIEKRAAWTEPLLTLCESEYAIGSGRTGSGIGDRAHDSRSLGESVPVQKYRGGVG